MTMAAVPLSFLGVFGTRVTATQAQFLLAAITQASSAILALVLTANILFTQLQPYALPVRFLVLWDRGTKITYALLAVAALLPAVLLLFAWYQLSGLVVALFAVSLVVLGWYIRTRPRSVTLDRFFDEMVTHPAVRQDSRRELYHMALTALDRSDVDTFRKSCLLLFSLPDGSDASYQFWNTVVERAQDEPEAVTPLAEAIYTCASPIAVTYAIGAAARPAAAGTPNPLFSTALAEQSPHYLARLLLLCGDRSLGALVRQEVLENLLLLVLDLVAACNDGQAGLAPLGNDVIPTLLGYLDDADDDVLLRVMRGDAVYHYLLFSLPGEERFGPSVRRELEQSRHRAWDRIVAHIYHDHGWAGRTHLELALWHDGAAELESVTGRERIEEVLGAPGEDGLRCEWHPPHARRGPGRLPRRK